MTRIIIVEDDYRIASIHEKFIKKMSNVTVVGKALTGKEAISLVESNDVDLVILDLYLPDMLGTEIIEHLRTLNNNIDFVIISAATEKDIVGQILRNGVFDYIIKPVNMERFIDTINRYKKMKQNFDADDSVDQAFLDHYFGYKKETSLPNKQTPKGIDPLTLDKVKEIITQLKEGITAEEMGIQIGASRTTARRYLEYLISVGEISAELEYGAVGRPERRYYVK
ncbi:response regulator [Anaerobacillus sp. MEB173]|uniref:response regulator n=1 Tax=Anaerobacillus sp. MEB173 TaxID=3383345 RepID=UPI003F8EE35A